jgi:hypothetical protein
MIDITGKLLMSAGEEVKTLSVPAKRLPSLTASSLIAVTVE